MSNEIVQYSEIEAAISELSTQYAIVPDCGTDGGLKLCKKQYREVRKYETRLEEKRKDLGVKARKSLANISDEAKRIDGLLKVISAPFKSAFEIRELEIKEAEERRIASIKSRIRGMKDFLVEAQSLTSEGIPSIIEAVDMINCAENFDEFIDEALRTKQDVVARLGEMLSSKMNAEEVERQRLDNEITQRINEIRLSPSNYIGFSSEDIGSNIETLQELPITIEEFGERQKEAISAIELSISQLFPGESPSHQA